MKSQQLTAIHLIAGIRAVWIIVAPVRLTDARSPKVTPELVGCTTTQDFIAVVTTAVLPIAHTTVRDAAIIGAMEEVFGTPSAF